MSTRRVALAGALLVTLSGASCGKKRAGAEAPLAPTTAAAPSGEGSAGGPIAAVPTQPARKVQVRASVEGLGDMLDAVSVITERVDPDAPWDARANLKAAMLTAGFGPGFLESLDLAGLHAVALGIDPTDDRAERLDLGGTIATLDARRLIDGMPASFRPESLGSGRWRLEIPADTAGMPARQALLRESSGAIEFGLDEDDLAAAAGLRAELGPGRRIRVRVWDLPTATLSDAADQIPGSLRDSLGAALRGAKTLRGEVDFGTKRDAQLYVAAEAPFRKLGIEALGPPRASVTALERGLPAAAAAVTVSIGDPTPVHRQLDAMVPVDQIPDPFGAQARRALQHVHTLLDQGRGNAGLALYLSPRGQATVVIAAEVENETTTRDALRGLAEVMRDAIEAQGKLAGAGTGLAAKWQPGGVRAGRAKGDLLTITIPKDLEEDAGVVAPFLAGNRIEQVMLVHDGVGLVAIGSGARTLVTTIVRRRGKRLGDDAGLVRLRGAMGGCQVCITADAVALMRLRLLTLAPDGKDKAASRLIARTLKSLARLGIDAKMGAGLSIEAERAALAAVLPNGLVLAPAPKMKQLIDAAKLIERDGRPPEPDASARGGG